MSTLAVPSAGSHELSRSDSVASSVVSHVSTNSFLPVIKQEDLFSASFVLSAVADASNRAGEAAPRAPYLRPVSTFNTPALSPSSAGMRSSDTLVRVDTHSSSATTPVPPLPPTRPLVISHQRRSIRSRLSLSRATPADEPQVEHVKTKRAFSLPFNMPSHSTLSLATSSIMSNELPNLLDDAVKHGAATTPPAAESSWVPPPPPIAQGQSEAPVKGKGGPGWYGGKRINDKGEVVQVGADGVETVIMKRTSLLHLSLICARRYQTLTRLSSRSLHPSSPPEGCPRPPIVHGLGLVHAGPPSRARARPRPLLAQALGLVDRVRLVRHVVDLVAV